MYSALVRCNTLFFFSLSSLAFLSLLCSVSYSSYAPPINVEFLSSRVHHFRGQGYRFSALPNAEHAAISTDIFADLRPLWHWNVKQLYVWIEAEYSTPSRSYNEVLLWDGILPNITASQMKMKDVRAAFPLTDPQKELKGQTLNLTLNWDVMPIIGLLKIGRGKETHSIKMPLQYTH